jgi:hypothetical protein
VRHHVLGAIVFLITLGLTSGALELLKALSPHPARLVEAVVLVIASACATVTRFVGLSSWVFPDNPAPITVGTDRRRGPAARTRRRRCRARPVVD